MSWIQTFTGRKVDPTKIKPSDIAIEDIAHALALINRFTGHTLVPYSVAQHSILVAQRCPKKDALWGLLHDAPEAYLCDMSRPAKQAIRAAGCTLFDEIDRRVMQAVCEAFDLDPVEPVSVKKADEDMLCTEGICFFGHTKTHADWHHQPRNGFDPLWPSVIVPWPWEKAEVAFLAAFRQLQQ